MAMACIVMACMDYRGGVHARGFNFSRSKNVLEGEPAALKVIACLPPLQGNVEGRCRRLCTLTDNIKRALVMQGGAGSGSQGLAQGVSGGAPGPAGSRRPFLPNPTQVSWTSPLFPKNLPIFSCVHVDMWWIGPMWPKCAFGDQKGLMLREAMLRWQSSASQDKRSHAPNSDSYFCLLSVD